jgi:hypothetical protein
MSFLVVVMVFIITYIGVYLLLRYRTLKLQTQWKKFYGDLISQVALCEKEAEINEVLNSEEIHFFLHKKFKNRKARLFLIDLLLHFKKQIKGNAEQNIQWLYLHLQLDKDSLRKLKKGNWKQKAKALQELSQLGNESFSPLISKYSSHSNLFIRNEAQLAMVRLDGLNGLSFLDHTTLPITRWHQLSLLHELSFKKIAIDERLRAWVTSANESVVMFALLLVEVSQCYERHDEVAACLSHSSRDVSQKALYILQTIIQEKTLAHLITFYPNTDASGQFSILRTLQEHGTVKELPFLFTILNNSNETNQLAAVKAIQKINKEEDAFG